MPFFYLTGHLSRSITPECTHPGLGSFHFARRYFGNRFFFLMKELVSFYSSGYLDVSVHRVPPACLCIHHAVTGVLPDGFPHSDICGSVDICSSPQLFAAYHVFLRLLVPRHPPCALISLTITLLHSVATVGRSELFSVCNLRYLCLLLNDFSFFLRIFRCASDVLKLACSFLYKHLFLDISVCSFQCTIFYYEVFRLRLETERFELLTPCLQGRCSPN